jgi:hypothetical protein
LLTNGGSKGQRLKIDRFDLAPLFDAILIEGEVGFGKPDPRIYTKALEALDACAHRSLDGRRQTSSGMSQDPIQRRGHCRPSGSTRVAAAIRQVHPVAAASRPSPSYRICDATTSG